MSYAKFYILFWNHLPKENERVYITIDRKWLEDNLDKLGKRYQELTGSFTTIDEKIVIDDEIESSYVKVEDSDGGVLHIEESSDHVFTSTFVDVKPNVVADLVRYWRAEIKELVTTLKESI